MKSIKYILPLLALPLLISCGAESDETAIEKEIRTDVIVVTDAQFKLGKMELGTFTKQPFQNVIQANGILDVPPENKSTVSAYFGGYVKNISLLQGQKITKGQTLFTLESPDYIQVQQDFLEAKSQLNYLKSDYERQKTLANNNVSSQKTYLKSEADYRSTLAKYESLKKKLQLMNMNPNTVTENNLSAIIAVKAPISGYVTSVSATKGMFLNPSDIALTIINADHMHIELTIFEQDLPRIFIGQEVSINVQNGKTPYKATVLLINKAIDPDKRTIKVHCHFSNESDALSLTPGMYVDAKIYASSDSSLALPTSAVVTIENTSYALVKKGNSQNNVNLVKVKVKAGQKSEGYVQILNAAEFDDKTEFLTNGAFNLIQE